MRKRTNSSPPAGNRARIAVAHRNRYHPALQQIDALIESGEMDPDRESDELTADETAARLKGLQQLVKDREDAGGYHDALWRVWCLTTPLAGVRRRTGCGVVGRMTEEPRQRERRSAWPIAIVLAVLMLAVRSAATRQSCG